MIVMSNFVLFVNQKYTFEFSISCFISRETSKTLSLIAESLELVLRKAEYVRRGRCDDFSKFISLDYGFTGIVLWQNDYDNFVDLLCIVIGFF